MILQAYTTASKVLQILYCCPGEILAIHLVLYIFHKLPSYLFHKNGTMQVTINFLMYCGCMVFDNQ